MFQRQYVYIRSLHFSSIIWLYFHSILLNLHSLASWQQENCQTLLDLDYLLCPPYLKLCSLLAEPSLLNLSADKCATWSKLHKATKFKTWSPMNERNEWRCHYLSCLLQLNMAGQLHVLTIKRYICMVVCFFRWVNYISCINLRSDCPGDRFTPNRRGKKTLYWWSVLVSPPIIFQFWSDKTADNLT